MDEDIVQNEIGIKENVTYYQNMICPSKQRCLDKNQANCGENLIA